MATLANQKPSDTFDSLLHIEDDTAGLVASSTDSRVVQDGVGANSALALATDSVRITSTNKLYFNDVGGEYISGNGSILSVVGGAEIDLTATAIDINGTADVSGTLTVGGDLTISSPGVFKGYMPWIMQASYNDTSSGAVFIPLGSSLLEDDEPDTDEVLTRLCMPYVGYLEKIIFRARTTADTIDFEIYKVSSGTDANDADQNKLGSTVQIEDDTAHTVKTATFGTAYSFVVGDIMAIKMTNESAPGDVDLTVIWRVLVD